ncbi:MAG: nuclease (SNase domain protein) [Myxococcaceae bacterium]|nr:nuclease (SNase domain protein) [Myxococcaceae bacterium]
MNWRLVSMVVLLAVVSHARGRSKKPNPDKHDAKAMLVLNGEETEVVWTDGDSFKIKSGQYKGSGTRLQRYNTLEAFGPVHQWGGWTPRELFEIAKASSTVAASQKWACTTDGKLDGYRRLLIDCPEAAKELVRQGHGLVYAVEGNKPDPELLAIQKEAQGKKAGIWAKGVVKGVITSLHSLGEDGEDKDGEAYNRVVDTRTGEALVRKHQDVYDTCQTVCEKTGDDQSCMIYVPFKRRYGGKPDCLR